MTNIFIANLDWEITSEDLNQTFSTFGKVTYAHVVFDRETKKSKGFGYVEMEEAEAAISAIQALNGIEINGRNIDVKIASPKSNRPKKEEKKAPSRPAGRDFSQKENRDTRTTNASRDFKPRSNNPNPRTNNRYDRN